MEKSFAKAHWLLNWVSFSLFFLICDPAAPPHWEAILYCQRVIDDGAHLQERFGSHRLGNLISSTDFYPHDGCKARDSRSINIDASTNAAIFFLNRRHCRVDSTAPRICSPAEAGGGLQDGQTQNRDINQRDLLMEAISEVDTGKSPVKVCSSVDRVWPMGGARLTRSFDNWNISLLHHLLTVLWRSNWFLLVFLLPPVVPWRVEQRGVHARRGPGSPVQPHRSHLRAPHCSAERCGTPTSRMVRSLFPLFRFLCLFLFPFSCFSPTNSINLISFLFVCLFIDFSIL